MCQICSSLTLQPSHATSSTMRLSSCGAVDRRIVLATVLHWSITLKVDIKVRDMGVIKDEYELVAERILRYGV